MAKLTNKVINGIPKTARELKSEIIASGNYTPETYRKTYDIIKLKLRTYEALTRAATPASPLEFFYDYEMQKKSPYGLQPHVAAVMAAPALSTAKRAAYAERQRNINEIEKMAKYAITFREQLLRSFAPLIDFEPYLQDAVEKIQNPYKLYDFLTEYADELHNQQKIILKKTKGHRTQNFGYDAANNATPYDSYLDESEVDE